MYFKTCKDKSLFLEQSSFFLWMLFDFSAANTEFFSTKKNKTLKKLKHLLLENFPFSGIYWIMSDGRKSFENKFATRSETLFFLSVHVYVSCSQGSITLKCLSGYGRESYYSKWINVQACCKSPVLKNLLLNSSTISFPKWTAIKISNKCLFQVN